MIRGRQLASRHGDATAKAVGESRATQNAKGREHTDPRRIIRRFCAVLTVRFIRAASAPAQLRRNAVGNRQVSFRVLVLLLLLLLCSVAVFHTLGPSRSDSHDLPTTPIASLDAIVTIAMCGFTATRMVQALRTDGRWQRPIYVVTNTPENEDDELCTPIDVRGNHPIFATALEFQEYTRGVQLYNPEIWSKWHKTQVFQLLPDRIRTVMFLDADMIAQRPLKDDWYVEALRNPSCHFVAYPERWYTKIPLLGKKSRHLTGRYNSGMWIAKREQSGTILKQWSDRMVHPPWMGRDQKKLTDAIDAAAAAATNESHRRKKDGGSSLRRHRTNVSVPPALRSTKGHPDNSTVDLRTDYPANDDYICQLPTRWRHVQNQADVLDSIWFGWIHGPGTFLHMSSRKTGDWKDMLAQKCDLSDLATKR